MTRPSLLLILFFAAACSSGEEPGSPAAPTEPEPPTPPAVSTEDLLADMPQEPAPTGREATVRARKQTATPKPKPAAPAQKQPMEQPTAKVPVAAKTPPPTAPAAQASPTAPSQSAPTTATTEAPAADGTLLVLSASMAREVVDRQPKGDGPFPDGSKVHCWTQLKNPAGKLRTIRHVWYHEGKQRIAVPLKIRGVTWRTWSRSQVLGKGNWRVDVVDESGAVLKSLPFVVN